MKFGRISCLRALILNPDWIWWHWGELRGGLKSWKTLRVEGSGWNLVGKISTSTRYIIDITGTDLLCFGELGGGLGLIQKKWKKLVICNLRRSDRILMKFVFWKDIVSWSSYFKSRSDLVTFGGVGGDNSEKLKKWGIFNLRRSDRILMEFHDLNGTSYSEGPRNLDLIF